LPIDICATLRQLSIGVDNKCPEILAMGLATAGFEIGSIPFLPGVLFKEDGPDSLRLLVRAKGDRKESSRSLEMRGS
jgi:hypothetical protein